ncbi:MAG: hypothetical protein GXX91_17850, partial [Verrucomicrobiaceae bacterium]|nr:hypothetical protein [Verrucomicrobiaceae bacterium]
SAPPEGSAWQEQSAFTEQDLHPRELEYTISPSGVLNVASLGRDGKIGGTGEDADISQSYRTIDENGKSLIGEYLWIVTAEIKDNSEQDGGGRPATPLRVGD